MLITSARVRSLVSDCKTEMEVASVLRSHKIKYSFATDTGFMTIRIPCRKGCVRVYRTCSRSAPFLVRTDNPSPVPHYPVPVYTYNY